MSTASIRRRRGLYLVAFVSLGMLILTTGYSFDNARAESAQPVVTPTAQASPGVSATETGTTAATQASANLTHQPTGTLRLVYSASAKTLNVNGMVNGLAPNSTHIVQIQQGSCADAKPGTVKYTLPPIKADENGRATINNTFNNVTNKIPASGLSVHVLSANKPQQTGQPNSLACKDIQNPGNNPNVQFSLGPSAGPNGKAVGTVQMSVADDTLTVSIDAQNVAPNSTHLVEVMTGTCQKPGNVVYHVPPIQADAQGNIRESAMFKGVSKLPSGNLAIFMYSGSGSSTASPSGTPASIVGTSTATGMASPTAAVEAGSPTATTYQQGTNEPIACGAVQISK